MSSKDLYDKFKTELSALVRKYKSPDLNVFFVLSHADREDDKAKSPAYLFYSGSIREVGHAIGDSVGRIVLSLEKKGGIRTLSFREEVLATIVQATVDHWDAMPGYEEDASEKTDLSGDQIDIPEDDFSGRKGNA